MASSMDLGDRDGQHGELDLENEEEDEVVIDPADVERHLQMTDPDQLADEVLTKSFPPVSASELVVRRAL